jgi:DNA mismatch endonuclease (patch repair protein)
VLRKYRTAIFVNGCFWHGHEGCSQYVVPKSNTEFWITKIERNRERDQKEYKTLKEAGWQVIVIWECQLKKGVIGMTMHDVEHLLNKNLLKMYK